MSRKSINLIGMLLPLMLMASTARAAGWRGIMPLQSTRADVERLLGLPGKHGRYDFENERAYIEYAGTGSCQRANNCVCVVSQDTVISIYVELHAEMKFSQLNLNKKNFQKLISPQDPTIATYSNHKEGIIYTVSEDDDDVSAIEYLPSENACEDALKRAKRKQVKTGPRKSLLEQNPPSRKLLQMLFMGQPSGGDSLTLLFA